MHLLAKRARENERERARKRLWRRKGIIIKLKVAFKIRNMDSFGHTLECLKKTHPSSIDLISILARQELVLIFWKLKHLLDGSFVVAVEAVGI